MAIQQHQGHAALVDAVQFDKVQGSLVTDNIVYGPHIALYPEFWGIFGYEPRYVNRVPVKTFNCLINRVCRFRQTWFYQLIRRNLLDQGWVSFRLDSRLEPRGAALYDLNFQGNEIFQAEHLSMRHRVPFCNFHGDLDQVMVDSCVSLVIETYFDRIDTIALSEKIFRALQLPRPFWLFGSPGAVAVLRQHGFDVWDDWIDHSYDSEPNAVTRQIHILDQIQHWVHRGFSATDLANLELRARANRKLLQQLRQVWPDRLQQVCEQLQSQPV